MTNGLDIKQDFGIFDQNPDLVYLDSASTTLVPKPAVAATTSFLNSVVASTRRGAHRLAVRGGAIVEEVRDSLAQYLNTEKSQISFQKSIPSTIGSLVYGYDWKKLNKNKIIVAQSEENSVLVAMLRAAEVLGLTVETIPMDVDGVLSLEVLEDTIDDETGIVAVGHVTPGFGLYNPIEKVAKIVHTTDALLLTDTTRSAGFDNSITSLGSDILVFSANVGLMGPPGLALQWLDKSLGEKYRPGILGGSAVSDVQKGSFEPALQPDKFEPGTLNVPAVAGLGASLDYLTKLYSDGFHTHLKTLSKYMYKRLTELPGLVIYGKPSEKTTVFGLNLNPEVVNCHDIALFLDESNVAVRSGLICAHPSVQAIADEGIIQASLHAYNSVTDIDYLIDTLTTISNQLL
ncbi:MAG: aminotransferase class V-fold PLP-dependent enzyme [Candidatus Thorarchaeota archaeon]|jgi:cysteine desulfurase/selenocysteine lyase